MQIADNSEQLAASDSAGLMQIALSCAAKYLHLSQNNPNIQAVNSPFESSVFRKNCADRWVRQGKAMYTPDGRLLFKDSFARKQQIISYADEQFDRLVDSVRGGEIQGEWVARHSGPPLYGGVGPETKTQQFVMTVGHGK